MQNDYKNYIKDFLSEISIHFLFTLTYILTLKLIPHQTLIQTLQTQILTLLKRNKQKNEVDKYFLSLF